MDDSVVEVEGICSFPAEPDGYNGYFLTKSEMESKLSEMVNQPILEEHSGKQIGKVKGGVIENEQIKAFIEVSRDNIEGIRAISKLRDGTLKGLSLGIEFLVYNGEEKRVLAKDMKELSLTAKPDCPTALINTVRPDSELWIAKTNFWSNTVKNQNLENNLYKSIEVLREVSEEKSRMSDAAPEKGSKEETKNTEESSEKVDDLNEQTKILEEKSQFYEEELLRITDLFGGEEQMKAIVKEQMKQREKNREKEIEQKREAGDWIAKLAEKEPDAKELVKEAREKLEKEQGGDLFMRILGLAKANHETSQSVLEKNFQTSKSDKQKEKETSEAKKRKWRSELYSKDRKEEEERPTKRQKLLKEKSFGNRWSQGVVPADKRSKVFAPETKGARGHFNKKQYKTMFGE